MIGPIIKLSNYPHIAMYFVWFVFRSSRKVEKYDSVVTDCCIDDRSGAVIDDDVYRGNLTTKTVQGTSLTFKGIDHIHSGYCLTFCVLSISDRITDDVFQKYLVKKTNNALLSIPEHLYTHKNISGRLMNA